MDSDYMVLCFSVFTFILDFVMLYMTNAHLFLWIIIMGLTIISVHSQRKTINKVQNKITKLIYLNI
jgi:hypothetical protein